MKRCNICKNAMKEIQRGTSWAYYRCPNCHWYSTEAVFSSQGSFDYGDYATFDADENKYDEYVNKAIKMLKYKFSLAGNTPKSFLDIGCSEGPFVMAATKLGLKASGIEVSENKVIRARNRGLDVGDYKTEFGKYDFVLLRHVIEHVEEPYELLNMIIDRYVSKDGVLFIETPNNESVGCILRGNQLRDDRFCRELYPPTHVCGFTVKTFKSIKNLQVTKVGTSNMIDDRWGYEGTSAVEWSTSRKIRQSIKRALGVDGDVYAIIQHR